MQQSIIKKNMLARRILSILLAFVLGLSSLPLVTTQAYAALASTAYLSVGKTVSYDNYATCEFTVDGVTAYCINPSKPTPSSGSYTVEAITASDLADSSRLQELIANVYYGYGGPGFDESMWPDTWYDGSSMTDDNYIALTHILIADTYSSEGWYAMYGCSSDFMTWVYNNIIGINGETVLNASATGRIMASRANSVPDSFTIYKLNTGDSTQSIITYVAAGDIELTKTSSATDITDENDLYSLEGAVYTVYSDESCTTSVGTITTDEDGYGKLEDLEVGTYYIKETTAPTGYWLDDTVYTVTVQASKTTSVEVSDVPANDPAYLAVVKYDEENAYTAINLPSGSASLAGAEFTIEYYATLDYDSYEELVSAEIEPTRSWIVATDEDGFVYLSADYLVSGDDFYYDAYGKEVLPRGTVVIYESKAPSGYLINDTVSFQKIQENVTTSNVISYQTVETPEQVIRGDFEFNKATDTGKTLAGIPFLLTSTTTGESHVIVTDENGYFSSLSSWNAHSTNTNANDDAVTFNQDGTYTIDENVLDATAGVWFSGLDEETAEADEDFGALPYDTYLLQELRCSANEGYSLVTTTVTISRDGVLVKLGTLIDSTSLNVEIYTFAYDGADSDNYIGIGTVNLVDRVTYSNTSAGETYTLTGQIYDAETGEPLLIDDEPVVSSTTFTAETTYGITYVEFEFDTYGLEGKTLVVYETLTDKDGTVVAEHKDATDENQQVTVLTPEIGTTAVDGVDGDKEIVIDEKVSIVDTVAYRGLSAGESYSVTGILMDKATGEALLDANGNEITSSTTFTAEDSSGSVEVTFTFDASLLQANNEIVVFESLYHNEREIAVDADINNLSQTVSLVQTDIGTTAVDGLDGDKTIVADAEATITDTVSYSEAIVGETYTLAGILMDVESGLPILTDEGSELYTDDDLEAFLNDLASLLGIDDSNSTLPVSVDVDSLNALLKEYEDLISYMVTSTKSFTAESADGTASMDFIFNANDVIDRISGETKDIVVFEILFKGSFDDELLLVATETDLENEDQSVILVPSSISTTATDATDGDHYILPSTNAVITDTVSYLNLIPGQEYILKATLYDAETGEPLVVDDETVEAEIRFTPNYSSGSVTIDLGAFDATELNGHDLVVFEELYKQSVVDDENVDILVAEHKDIEDEGQTVTVSDTVSGSAYGKTGGNIYPFIIAIVALAALASGAGVYAIKYRKKAVLDEGVSDSDTDSEEIKDEVTDVIEND